MTTIVFLIRHAVHSLADRVLVGRTPGIALSRTGLQQAYVIAERMQHEPISSVQCSPQMRARQTAQPIANALEVPIEIIPEMDELDTGDWEGLSFDELANDPRWNLWNSARGSSHVPNGESMRDVQDRVLAHLADVKAKHRDGRVVIVSHAEPIRAALLHYRGIRLDDFMRVRVDPASITTLLLHEHGAEIAAENERVHRLVAA